MTFQNDAERFEKSAWFSNDANCQAFEGTVRVVIKKEELGVEDYRWFRWAFEQSQISDSLNNIYMWSINRVIDMCRQGLFHEQSIKRLVRELETLEEMCIKAEETE